MLTLEVVKLSNSGATKNIHEGLVFSRTCRKETCGDQETVHKWPPSWQAVARRASCAWTRTIRGVPSGAPSGWKLDEKRNGATLQRWGCGFSQLDLQMPTQVPGSLVRGQVSVWKFGVNLSLSKWFCIELYCSKQTSVF